MARTPHSPQTDDTGAGADTPVDRLPIYLRGYAAIPPRREKRKKGDDLGPSDWVLIFDTETTTDAAQRLRMGTYQLLNGRRLEDRGVFFDPHAVTEEEVETLTREATRLGHRLLWLEEFVENIVFGAIYSTGGTIVGFNLPFDLSRLALDWDTARTSTTPEGIQN